ncbi:MAG: DUF1573 domain-containing protein [Chitinophagaceae bacterium]
MKKVLLLATAFAFTLGAMAQPSQTKPEDVIKVNSESHDFGKIKQGEPVTYVFELKNISDKPVVVESTSASCGCTTPEKPTEPILPGAVGKVKVVYNAAAAAPFTKDVYIKLAGIDAQKIVHITGEVLTAEAYEAYKKGGSNEPQKQQSAAQPTAENKQSAPKTLPATSLSKPKMTSN